MARHEIHLVEVPVASKAPLVALTRRVRHLNEAAVLQAVAAADAEPRVVAVVETVAEAESVRAELEKIGCTAVIIEQAGVGADLRDRLRDVFVRRKPTTGSAAVAPGTSAPPVATLAPGTPASAQRGVYQRLYGSSPADLEKADAQRRLRIQLAVAFGVVATLGMLAALFIGLSSLADRAVNANLGGEEQIDSDGNVVSPERPSSALPQSEPEATEEAAEEPSTSPQRAADHPQNRNAAAGRSTPPPPSEAHATTDRPREQQPAPAVAERDPSPTSEESRGPIARAIILALAAFIGFVAATLLFIAVRWLGNRFVPRWVAVLASLALLAVGSVATVVAVSDVRAASAERNAAATAAPGSRVPERGASTDSVDDGEMPAQSAGTEARAGSRDGSAAELNGSGDAAPTASMASFVRSLPADSAPAAPERPFTEMASRLASRSANRSPEGSGAGPSAEVADGSGGLRAAEDFDTAEQIEVTPTAKMSDFVASLDPPTGCDADVANPFGAMLCRLEETGRAERRRARERDRSEQDEAADRPASNEGSAGGRADDATVVDGRPGDPSGEGGAQSDDASSATSPDVARGAPPVGAPRNAPQSPGASAPSAADGTGSEAPASPETASSTNDAPAPDERSPSEPRAEATADQPEGSGDEDARRLTRERREESLAMALGALLAVVSDLIRWFRTRRSRQGV